MSLFKDAIADAKAIRETAMLNAKAAIEEAFTPHLKSALAAQLEEMEKEEENENLYKMEEEGTETMDEEMDLDELLASLEEEEIDEEPTVDEDVELEELLASLNEEEGEEEMGAEETEDETEEEIDIENMTPDQLEDFIKDVVKDMVAAGEIELEGNEEMMEEAEDLDEYGAEHEKSVEDYCNEMPDDEVCKKLMERKRPVANKEMAKMKEDLNEALKANKVLKDALTEVNLLNAKLLYTNKIFKSKSLTETQKVKVINSFDKATTVKEVKLVFESLVANLSKTAKPIRESLGFASKAITPKSLIKETQNPGIIDPAIVAKFQKIAGITKD
jgi:hypothetical protein